MLDISPLLLYTLAILFGLSIGSFLNVVIYRLPMMLEKKWQLECEQQLNRTPTELAPHLQKKFNLSRPRSHCPHCKQQLKAWHNIPLISYLLLKGRCTYCQHPIAWRYPLIELAAAVITIIVILQFGITWHSLFALIYSYGLLTLASIDTQHQLLPDTITIPLLWLGLLVSTPGLFADSQSAIIGAVAAYTSLWCVAKAYQKFTGKIGMGHGDFKLFAVFGAWLGWSSLPLILLAASVIGAIVGLLLICFKQQNRHTAIPFGPFLAAAGWIALLWHEPIIMRYLGHLPYY